MSDIRIREALETDAPGVAEVSRSALATLRETYRPRRNATPLEPLPPRSRLVAVEDERVLGTVQFYRDDDRLHLIGLFVYASQRRKGVARTLVARLAELAGSEGARKLSLYTIRQTGNVAVFERLGFSVVREERDSFAESDRHAVLNEVYMERLVENTDQ